MAALPRLRETRPPESKLQIVTFRPRIISVWVTQSSFDMLLLSYKTKECLASQVRSHTLACPLCLRVVVFGVRSTLPPNLTLTSWRSRSAAIAPEGRHSSVLRSRRRSEPPHLQALIYVIVVQRKHQNQASFPNHREQKPQTHDTIRSFLHASKHHFIVLFAASRPGASLFFVFV